MGLAQHHSQTAGLISAKRRARRACRRCWPLGRPLVMGILNVTPDSFSDGGRFIDPARAIAHAGA